MTSPFKNFKNLLRVVWYFSRWYVGCGEIFAMDLKARMCIYLGWEERNTYSIYPLTLCHRVAIDVFAARRMRLEGLCLFHVEV